LALAIFADIPARADAVLEQLAGEWVGRGTGSARPGAPQEKVYCRITNTSAGNGAVLEQSGRCAVGNDTGALSSRIRALGGGRYEGTMSSPVMSGQARITGTGSSRGLDLEAVYEDSATHNRVKAVTSLRILDKDRYRMVTKATDLSTGGPVQSSEVLFSRQ